MIFLETQLHTWLALFIWPLLRIGALVASAPILSSRQVPNRIRIGLVLLLTYLVMPLIPQPAEIEIFAPETYLIALQQILIGVTMGFVLQMVFGAVVFGGQALAYSMGLGYASMVDPQNGVQVPVLSQFFIILMTLLFLVLDGHLLLIELVIESFHTFPVAIDGITRSGFIEVVAWGSRMFVGGLSYALPAMAILLMTNLGMGIITRAAPQLNIFAVGFPMTMLIGFVTLWVVLPDVLDNFGQLLVEGFALIQHLLRLEG